jgi:hypothetical protein
MKKLTLFTIAISLCSIIACRAQSVEVKNKGVAITYKTQVLRAEMGNLKIDNLLAYNTNNKLHNQKQILTNGLDLGHLYTPVLPNNKKEKNQLMVALLDALPKKRIEELVKEEYITVNMYVNGKGEIMEVEFTLKRPTSITAKELELMENSLKKKGRIEILYDDFKGGYNFFVVPRTFFFKDYLNQNK